VIDFIDMEEGKNQRAVEQRLKDALHYDRARVQMGKISRFGLMELSRQRLRPALSEGSHVTCPRCNGVGVIRDTESSALHILRILQEEAMKEGTAAVHAQVPVEVATFLLNEKRADIAKLEARLRVSVVLIPNKFLDTPHYHIERLRHDDPRLDEAKASFERAADLAPSTDTPYTTGKGDLEKERPKQEAVVKGIVPETPAPVAVAPVEVAIPAPTPQPVHAPSGLWGRIVSFFTGGPAPQPVTVAPAAAKPAGEKPARDDEKRGDRRRGRHDGRRDGRRDEKRGERGGGRDDKRDERRDGKRDEARRGEAKQETRERRPDGRAQEPRPAGETPEGRKPRGERRPERERKAAAPAAEIEGVEVTPVETAAPVATATTASLVTADAATEVPQEERRRRRRRRRGRGARSGEEGGSATEAHAAYVGDQDEFEGEAAEAELPAEEAVPAPDAAVQPSAPVAAARPAPAPAPIVTPTTPVAVAGITTLRTPDMITVPATVALPVAQPAPLPVDQLQPVLELAGLTLVQTQPEKHAEAVARLAAEPRPVRRPRERPILPPMQEGPLVQVETRPSSPPPGA
jgi:ribonuclease E